MCLYFMGWLNWANYHAHHLTLFAFKPVGSFEICLYQQQLPRCASYLTQLNMDLWLMPWPPTSGDTLQHTVPLVLIFLGSFYRDSMLYCSFWGWLKLLLPNFSGSSQWPANVIISSISEVPIIALWMSEKSFILSYSLVALKCGAGWPDHHCQLWETVNESTHGKLWHSGIPDVSLPDNATL